MIIHLSYFKIVTDEINEREIERSKFKIVQLLGNIKL